MKTENSAKSIQFYKEALGSALNNIGYVYSLQSNSRKAVEYYNISLEISEEIGDSFSMAYSINNIASIVIKQGDVATALAYYSKSLGIFQNLKDKKGMGLCLNNLAAIYDDQGENAKALEYFNKSLKIKEELGDKRGLARALQNIGSVYVKYDKLDKALIYGYKSQKINIELDDKFGIAESVFNLGGILCKMDSIEKGVDLLKQSLVMFEEFNSKAYMAYNYHTIGYEIFDNNLDGDPEFYAQNALKIGQEIGNVESIKRAADLLSSIYEKQNKGMKALEMQKLYIQMRDSLNNSATQKATAKQQAKYEYDKQKAIDDAENDKLLAIEQEEKEKQQILTTSIAIGLVLVIAFLIFVFNRLRIIKKQKLTIENQKREVEEQKEVVEIANNELEEKNQEIMDSIVYAKRIQSAILPTDKIVKEYLQDSFILYKPKDIVAGDFYWMEHKDDRVLFAAADCTGHGVPGAMVSVICNNALNRSVREHGLKDPGKILDKTRDIVVQEFEKSDEEVKDGMDIAICSLEGNKLEYAGAHNPLWIIRKGELLETKANKQPVGQFDNPEPYTTHTLNLEQGDAIYIFSDGYVDQFGGEKGKKYKTKAFRELLLSIQSEKMEQQKIIIDNAFETWRGDVEQVDDVCVIGIKI